MAKTYLDIVKYMVDARFSISGPVDKPDIIGAVFGQTEGLLGDELDLRELQKNGKIGRIEIEISQSGNKSYGRLLLPASLDKVETCILAAAVEAVDRVGPYECQFKVEKVEDTRTEKRKKILDRARSLVKQLMDTGMPDSRELAELVQAEVRSSEIVAYGPEALPAGPDIDKSEEMIIVEGRADVLNLLRYDIGNAIAVGGATTNIPKAIIKLCNEKNVTVFVDGDRGGDLIIRSILNTADVDYVTKAPEGREVEELTRKEVIKSLRTKITTEQYTSMNRISVNRQPPSRAQEQPQRGKDDAPQPGQHHEAPHEQQRAPARSGEPLQEPIRPPLAPKPALQGAEGVRGGEENLADAQIPKLKYRRIEEQGQKAQPPEPKPALESWILERLATGLNELSDSLRSRLYNAQGDVVSEVPIRELLNAIHDSDGLYGIVLDGIITQRLVDLALQKNVHAIYGLKANAMPRKHPDIILFTKEQGRIE
jgi:DNA primase